MPSPAYYDEYDKKGAKENADHPMELNMRISHPDEKLSLEEDSLPLESDSFLMMEGEEDVQGDSVFLNEV